MSAVASRAYLAIALAVVAAHLACWFASEPAPRAAPLASSTLQLRLNPNTATAAELELLPRIGPVLAERIVAYRAAAAEPPAFRRAEDLDRVPQIGAATVEALRPYLLLPETPP
jgi:competence ComEA-like helix-hairpin-helix protein